MKISVKKRFLAWMITFLMVFTYVPATAYATDVENVDPNAEVTAAASETNTGEEQASAVVDESADETTATSETTDDEAIVETYDEILVLGDSVLIVNSKGTGTVDGNDVVTITAPGAKTTTPTPNIIDIYNQTESAATLTFEYEATNYSELSVETGSGTYSKTLAAGEAATLSITGKEDLTNNTATIKMYNFTLEAVQETSTVTFDYENTLGSVTVAGDAVEKGGTVTAAYADGIELTATPNSDVRFIAWVNKDNNKILSTDTTYTLKPIKDMAVEAVFVDENSKGYYMAGSKYLFSDLSKAAAKASDLTDKTVVLMNDATLTGAHTIPAGVTFLLPFDDANTVYTTAPEGEKGTHVTPTVYRQLTMADGASITVNGVLSLSAKHHAAVTGSNGGSPTGDVSQIVMEKGSAIDVKDGAALYAYGYIIGEGDVTAEKGAVVYEYFQFEDWRGGTASLGVAYDEEKHGVFPISQYYVQNIEVPLTLEAGASEYVYTSVNIGGTTVIGAAVEFMGSSKAMFNLEDGFVVKSYDGTKDRLNIIAEGNMNLSPITVTMGSNSLDCREYELPINSNITVEMNKGTAVINQDLALLPGSEIVIAEDAVCELNDGVGIYVYDSEQWGNFCGASNVIIAPINYAPGKTYNRTEKDLVDAKVLVDGHMDASAGYIYSTITLDENGMVSSGGANIISNGGGVIETKSGDQKYTYQFSQNGTEGSFVDIRVFPALLANEDGSYVQTWDLETAGKYTYENGMWVCNHAGKTETVKTPAGCLTEGVKVVSCELDADYHNYSYEVVIPATGHTKVTDKAVAETCTTDGKTEGSHCKTCGEVLKAQETIEAKGHQEVVMKAIAATCETDGLTEGKYCSVCNEVLVKQDIIPATGHDWVVEGQEPTCTVDGYGSSVCNNCNQEIKGDTIPALGHDYKWSETKAPACETAGEETGVCQRTGCGHETTREIAATGHVYKTYVETTAPTCTEAGEATAECENGCGAIDVKEIEAEGHTWKTGDEGQPLYEEDEAPTCTAVGSESVHCENCDASKDAREIPATGHTEEKIKAVKPTCTETGLTEGSKCTVCGEIVVAQEEVPSYGGHKWDKGEVTQIPRMVKNPDTSAKLGVIYESGTRYFACQNDGCKESKTETVDWGEITTYDEFIENLAILEDWAFEYAVKNNIEDSAALTIRYVRTGVDRYNSGSWEIMAGVDNSDFTDWVTKKELEINDAAETDADKVNVTGLKNIDYFNLPNGERVDFGHMFGTIDISYTNKNSINHADVAGLFGDTTDLLSTADRYDVSGTVLEMTAELSEKYFCVDNMNWEDKFGMTDMLGDLDGYYLNHKLLALDYAKGDLTKLCEEYFTEDLTEKQRAEYYLENRLQCGTSKAAVRNAVYMAYTGNSVITTLEGTRTFKATGDDLADMRKAACYVVADYLCKLAGDYTADIDNPYFTVQSEEFATLAPGITQESKTAVMHSVDQDGNPIDYDMEYYIATVDITRDDVNVYANYPDRPIKKDENGDYIWSRMTVLEQANKAQETYGNPDSDLYIENYNVVVSTNADGFDMTGSEASNRGEPGGLLIMDGEEIAPITANGFFGITKEGKAVIGTAAEYNNIYKDQIAEAVGGFGTMLVKDGKIVVSSRGGNAPRTAVGITASGKVVMMVLDGRQQRSEGGDMLEIAHIMLEAGCVAAINLDGGGSTTYVAKQPGEEELSLINHPSDGYPRAIGSSLMAVSTAKSSTVFDHADLKAPTNYMTVGSEMQITASGITSTGNAVDVPAEATWAVSNDKLAAIDAEGNLTALRTGSFDVQLMLDGVSVGQKRITVVVPDTVSFTKANVDVVYESKVTLPIKAYYEGKAVTVNADDFIFTVANAAAGKMDGLDFVAGSADSGLKNVAVTAAIKGPNDTTIGDPASITVRMYNQGEGTFDFDKKTGGDRKFAWQRVVSNAETADNSTYYAIDKNKDMEVSYTFAIDMTQIPIPEVLEELTDMLPGNDVEGACAWTYLCNLAQRISDTTQVVATVKIDDNYKLVDIDKIAVKNEYFKFPEEGGVVYNEDTNTVTLTLNWVRQYSPIDLEMADPLCMVTGIKLVPKDDADWGETNTINLINEGSVSYDVYMRASSLYTFCNDKSNQEKYGLKPFSRTYIDKDGVEQSEAGGGFGSTYTTFTDSFTLVNAEKNGWIVEDGGWTYYKEGDRLTGIQQITERVNGVLTPLYYDFGDTGVISEQKPYTGMIVEYGLTGKTYSYAVNGVLTGGWVEIDGVDHYFDPATKKALPAGKHAITVTARGQSSALGQAPVTITNTVTYELDETGKVMNGGTWFVDSEGKTYFYYGSGFLCRQWGEKDGEKVYFAMTGHLLRGIVRIREDSNRPGMYYMFDEETCAFIQKCEGFVEYNGVTFYYPTEEERMAGLWPEDVQDWNAEGDVLKYGRAIGLQKIDGKYYLFASKGGMLTGNKSIAEYNTDGCQSLNFSKAAGGYAVDVNGNPVTSLSHNSVKTFIAPTATTKGGECMKCSNCGEILNWTKVVTFKQYVNSTTIKAKSAASVKDETITLTWTKSSEAKMTRYDVYRSKTGKAGSFKKIGKSTTTKYVDKTVKPGTTYYYKVQGVSVVKGVGYKTKYSNVAKNKVKKVTAKYVKESKMTIRSYYAGKGIKVTWTNPRVKVDGYEIWRSNKLNGTYKKIKTTGTSARQWTNKGLKLQSRYYYKVRGYKIVNGKKVYTKFSAKGFRYVLSAKNAKLANAIEDSNSITAKSAVKIDKGIKVTWTKKSSVKCNKYEVWRSTSKNGKYTKIATTKNKYYNDTSAKLKSGTRYYYKIVGYRVFGKACPKTKASNVVSAVR